MNASKRRCAASRRGAAMNGGITRIALLLLPIVVTMSTVLASIPAGTTRSCGGSVGVLPRSRAALGLEVCGGGINGYRPATSSSALTPYRIPDVRSDSESLNDAITECLSTSTSTIRGGSTSPFPGSSPTSTATSASTSSGGGIDKASGGQTKSDDDNASAASSAEISTAAQYAKKLKNRNRTNIKRKILHCTFGLFFAGLHHVIPRNRFVPGMTILTSATLVMELLRYRKGFGWMNDALHFVLGNQLRKHEMEGKFTGSFYYFFGVTMTAYLFPRTPAILGISQLAIADPSASFFGRHTRHIYWSRIEGGLGGIGRNKGVLGFLGGALFCFPYNYRVLSLAKWGAGGIPGGRQSLLIASLALGLAGAFADLAVPTPAVVMPNKILGIRVPPFHIDDNFVVPIFSGFACTKIFGMLGWPLDLELSDYILF
mmetsp:Transcript_3961/g.9072  ORF Transcript_3961/g.9072 Transcript_3961/m.9072 type:complete len:430 (+) Transcript_3961:107-1396(+)|eukprot:CAMPEP_0178508566 /NCGR_PEP_ID=MMETSP0696-20121128/20822_1 /TAXON_ID=265572 /ORGANISM="Extubocellulus spinifer, Strain CCMP396" /LENGTH=429 /DNA_ID=CAMNT_0020138131 /DNA_START=31 /DNA_END=1320 /DNA_ORIENTATION=-